VAAKGDVFGVGFAFAVVVAAFVEVCELLSGDAFVVIVRGLEAVIPEVGVDETEEICAVAAIRVVEGDVELDFAWKVGEVRARKAPKKLAKKGRLVGMMLIWVGWEGWLFSN